MRGRFWMSWLAAAAIALGTAPAAAQVRTIDPNAAIDSDLGTPAVTQEAPTATLSNTQPYPDPDAYQPVDQGSQTVPNTNYPEIPAPPAGQQVGNPAAATATTQADQTYKRDDLIGAAEGVFGKGAEGLAGIIEGILKDQGEPNGYIAGREASGAFVVGLRYGSGMLSHKVEGQMPVYWTGPSVGFDVGGDANKVFVLVYNLYDSEDLFKRFPAGEGHLYFVGGFSASYLRSGNVVLIPVRLGVGVRAGVNVGYMKFSHKQKWLPF
ncbi:DUF1134 domain-containing protein [Hephaestia sp. GCM10023244]|uniref:DUF1134 domain-containing protein n=1 Tax=unclassified Hephaestia TaxID=2631281 RepID=UPI0020770E1D|nr:DUF1134 domain-containing protein [Hephaestia sp. MAHUQ-44]MCM8732412.1 DUF1134 domain-containing protein [Hephaestia sp. MAHUQ-44]